jgi:hypothetical protein
MPEPEHVDGFEFGITLNYGADPDSVRLPRKFGDVVDVRTNQVLLRVSGGATGLWTAEHLFDRTSMPYLASGWRRFCQRHEIVVGHILFFNYDGDHQITITVFNETMCHRHYVAPARGKATVSSSSSEGRPVAIGYLLLLLLVLGYDLVCKQCLQCIQSNAMQFTFIITDCNSKYGDGHNSNYIRNTLATTQTRRWRRSRRR